MLKIKAEKMGKLEKFGFFKMGDVLVYGDLSDYYYTNDLKVECYILKDKDVCDI